MRRIKPKKEKWIKRINIEKHTYDYLYSKDHRQVIESTKNNISGFKYEYAEWHIVIGKTIKRDFWKWIEKLVSIWPILALIIGWSLRHNIRDLLSYIYDLLSSVHK